MNEVCGPRRTKKELQVFSVTLTRVKDTSSPPCRSDRLQPVLALTQPGDGCPLRPGDSCPLRPKQELWGLVLLFRDTGHVTMRLRTQPTCQSKVASGKSICLFTDVDTALSLESKIGPGTKQTNSINAFESTMTR